MTAAVFFLFGAGLRRLRTQEDFRNFYLDRLTEGETVTVCGRVERKELKNNTYRIWLTDTRLLLEQESCACNSVLLYFDSDAYPIGDTLLVTGQVTLFSEASCEGMFDLSSYYHSQKTDFALQPSQCEVKSHGQLPVGEMLWKLRQKMTRILQEAGTYCPLLGEEETGVLSSMLLGEKSLLDSDIRQLYQSAGISHILAISGLHLSLIGMGLYRFLRKRGMGYGSCMMQAGILVLAYGQMTGWAVSSRRACGMLLLSMAAAFLGRKADLLNSLGAVMLVLLWENPFLTGYSGFTFSCMAVTGIGVTAALFEPEEGGNTKEGEAPGEDPGAGRECLRRKIRKAIREKRAGLLAALASGGAITLTSLPLVAFYYYEIPVYSVLLNLLILPLVSILFLSGIAGMAVGAVWLPAGGFLLLPAGLILKFYSRLCAFCLALPGAQQIVGKPSDGRMLLFYSLLAVGLLLLYWEKRRKEPVPWQQTLLKLLTAGICVAVLLLPQKASFEVDILDVGQGDGIYVGTEDGTTFMIDGGSVTESQVGTNRLLPFLKYKGKRRVDYWIVSHGDEDHISGLEEVLASGYPVRYLVLSAEMPEDDARQELLAAAEAAGTEVLWLQQGDALESDTVRWECLYPDEEAEEVFEDRNDLSLSLLLTEKKTGFTALFAGDLSSEGEKRLIGQKKTAAVDLYKVCHHGSRYSSSVELMDAIRPKIAVISCGLVNSYGHPAEEAVERIRAAGAEVFYTMYSGELTIRTEGERLSVVPFTGRTSAGSEE